MSHALWNWLTRRSARPVSRPRPHRRRPLLEQLESRDLPSAVTAVATPDYVLLSKATASPHVSPGSNGYSPTQIETAYAINQISFNGVKGDGTGTTIAIIDAYDDPTLAADLTAFDAAYDLPAATLTKENENGGTTLPAGNASWSEEIALDVEWAHAIAPGAKILLVEASSASYSDLFAAVKTAATTPGVDVVSMSWGGSEFSGETSYDSYFTTPGVTFIASSGDAGAPPSYPSVSPNVLSVGGTTLQLSSAGTILSETGWSDSGGGISSQESQPSYQKGVVTQSTTKRTNPDVAYDADPNTGFLEYNSYAFPSAPWEQFGGTSDAAPQWAGIIAIADQGRALASEGSLSGSTQTLPMIYSAPASDFHDITSGTSTGSPHYSAGSGYDLVTGLGTPVANQLVATLVGSSSSNPTATHFSVVTTAGNPDIAGTPFSVTVTALSATNTIVTNYTGTVQFSSTDPLAALPANYTFTTGTGTNFDNGVHTFTVTLKTVGSDSITVANQSASSINGSASVTVIAAAASELEFVQQPTNATLGASSPASISPAVTVEVLDAYGNPETTGSVTLAFGSNPPPGSATLGGTLTEPVSASGVATFGNLTVNAAGTYTLMATSGTLTATSASFTISAASSGGGGGGGSTGGGSSGSGNLIEGFETPDSWYFTGYNESAYLSTAAKHDGTYGLVLNGNYWIYRTDAAATVNAGDTLSAWVQFTGLSGSRAYLGFGSSAFGTLSLVAAPNTGQLILQSNPNYDTYTNLAVSNQTYLPNHWYRLEVDWSTSGSIIGKIYDSNGTTLLGSVSTAVTGITTGGIALRSIGYNQYWDTITDNPDVNNFAMPVSSTGTSTQTSAEAAIAEYLAALAQWQRSHAPTGWGW